MPCIVFHFNLTGNFDKLMESLHTKSGRMSFIRKCDKATKIIDKDIVDGLVVGEYYSYYCDYFDDKNNPRIFIFNKNHQTGKIEISEGVNASLCDQVCEFVYKPVEITDRKAEYIEWYNKLQKKKNDTKSERVYSYHPAAIKIPNRNDRVYREDFLHKSTTLMDRSSIKSIKIVPHEFNLSLEPRFLVDPKTNDVKIVSIDIMKGIE